RALVILVKDAHAAEAERFAAFEQYGLGSERPGGTEVGGAGGEVILGLRNAVAFEVLQDDLLTAVLEDGLEAAGLRHVLGRLHGPLVLTQSGEGVSRGIGKQAAALDGL